MSDKDAREEAITRKEVFVRMASAAKNPNMTVSGAALMLEQCFNEFLAAERTQAPSEQWMKDAAKQIGLEAKRRR